MSEPYLPPEDVGASARRRGRQETETGAFFVRIGKLFAAGVWYGVKSEARGNGHRTLATQKRPVSSVAGCPFPGTAATHPRLTDKQALIGVLHP